MSKLNALILKMDDTSAIALLHLLVRAIQSVLPADLDLRREAQNLARVISLPVEPAESMPLGDVARSALMLLASDDRYSLSITKLLDSTLTFSHSSSTIVDGATLFVILQTQISALEGYSKNGQQYGLVRTLARQFLGMTGLMPTQMQADAEYQVWFATSRQPLDAQDLSKGFGTVRDSHIHYGDCRVFVPKSHQVGSTGSGWWKRTLLRTDDRLKLLATKLLDPNSFWDQVRQQLNDKTYDDRDAVVFIHGYNVDFNEAAMRAAQIGFDLQVRGVMAFYSWASRGTLAGYAADEATIELEEAPIANFLCEMASCSGARKVHVIVHSMGNRAVLRAMNHIVQRAQQRSGVRFGQVVLAAADVDVRKFKELCSAYQQLADRTTLYVSARDFPVESSRLLHDFPRVGLMPPVTIAPGIDTIDASSTDLTLLGHGYVAEARDVISDIHALIQHGKAPQHRFGLHANHTPQGFPYWQIGA